MPKYDKNLTLEQLQGHIETGEREDGPVESIKVEGDKTKIIFKVGEPKPNPVAVIAVFPYSPYDTSPNFDCLFTGEAWVDEEKKTVKVYRGNY